MPCANSAETASATHTDGEGWFAFDDVDADKDGRIGTEEFSDTGLAAEEEFGIFDDNKDGFLDQDEFDGVVDELVIGEQDV